MDPNSPLLFLREKICSFARWRGAVGLMSFVFSCALVGAEPEMLGPTAENEAALAREGDRVELAFMDREQRAFCIQSSMDGGVTWGAPVVIEKFADEVGYSVSLIHDQQGSLHAFYLVKLGSANGRTPGVDLFYQIYQSTRKKGESAWSPARMIFADYCGSIRRGVCRRNGDLVLPVYELVGRYDPKKSDQSPGTTFVLVSKDNGLTWLKSETRITSPIPANYLSSPYGAVEPSVVEFSDESLWLLVRTQTGEQYESRSLDGLTWTSPGPSVFRSSNSPADLLRLRDGRVLLLWNNCEMRPRVDNAIAYNGRDALHAAISSDDGKTWHGFREIFRDPARNNSPAKKGDRGTAYPQAVELGDGTILVTTGQGIAARVLVRFHPDWLLESSARSTMPDSFDEWHTGESFGPVARSWQDLREVARLTALPAEPSRRVLAFMGTDGNEDSGVAWNFPATTKGTLKLRLALGKGAAVTIALTESFFETVDPGAVERGQLVLPLPAESLGVPPGEEGELEICWDATRGRGETRVHGRVVGEFVFQREAVHGLSYLNLRATAASKRAGVFVSGVEVARAD